MSTFASAENLDKLRLDPEAEHPSQPLARGPLPHQSRVDVPSPPVDVPDILLSLNHQALSLRLRRLVGNESAGQRRSSFDHGLEL